MSSRNKTAFCAVILSFVLLYFGLTEPMLNVNLSTKVVTNLGKIDAKVLDKTQSILGTVSDLYTTKKEFVAFLIFLFSVLVPVTKGGLLVLVLLNKGPAQKIFRFVKTIGKWSMADVMVVAVFIAYLSTRFDEAIVSKQLAVFGMSIKVDILNQMKSTLMPGFYWFTAYCILSVACLEMIKVSDED